MEVVVYTDASQCHITRIAACGFLALQGKKIIKHEITIMTGLRISSEAEYKAISFALQYAFLLKGVQKILVFTEMEAIVGGTYSQKAISKSPILKEVVDVLQEIREYGVKVGFKKVRAHSNDKYNTIIDVSVRAELRNHLRGNPKPGVLLKKLPEKNNLFGYYDNWY